MYEEFSSELSSLTGDIWNSCDKDKDSRLSKQEIDLAMLDPAITGKRAAALATLKKSFDWLSGLYAKDHSTKKSITHADIGKLINNENTDQYLTAERFFLDAQDNLNNYEHSTYSKASNEPSKDDPVQGPLGDCYLVSALSAFADKRTKTIKELLSEDQPSNSYRVNFQMGTDKMPVNIPKPTESAIAYYRTRVDWPLTMQSAYGHLLKDLAAQLKPAERTQLLTLHGLPKSYRVSTLDQDNLDSGGYPMITMMILGGSIAARQLLWDAPMMPADKAKILKVLESGVIGSSPAVACTSGDPSVNKLGLIPHHAYSLVDYIPDTHMVRLRNPHGNLTKVLSDCGLVNVDGKGEIDVPLETFIQAFGMVDIYYDRPTVKADEAFAAINPPRGKKKKLDLCLHAMDMPDAQKTHNATSAK